MKWLLKGHYDRSGHRALWPELQPELKSFSPSLIRQEFNELWKWRKLYIGSVGRIRHWYVRVLEKLPTYNSFSCMSKCWDANAIYTQSQWLLQALTLHAKTQQWCKTCTVSFPSTALPMVKRQLYLLLFRGRNFQSASTPQILYRKQLKELQIKSPLVPLTSFFTWNNSL